MIRRPPRSTLFPCTPLFRSLARRGRRHHVMGKDQVVPVLHRGDRLGVVEQRSLAVVGEDAAAILPDRGRQREALPRADRKSTRLNSSHANISYAVFCLKKKN